MNSPKKTGVRSVSEATAIFSDDFQFPGTSIYEDMHSETPEFIEKCRLVMAARPGMLRKLLPLREDSNGLFCGGAYLFDTYENAQDYAKWCAEEFTVDGIQFLDLQEILELTPQLWRIAGAEDFAPIQGEQKVMRFQRWHLPEAVDPVYLREKWWPSLREAAVKDGLTSAYLLAGTDARHPHPQLGVILTSDGDPNKGEESLRRMESWQSPGQKIAEALNGTKALDRTSWLYMVWHPIEEGDLSPDTADWPVSPALPGLKVHSTQKV